MKFEELKKNLRQNIEPCYIINGGESFLTTNALKIIEETLNITLPDFNKSVFSDNTIKSATDIVDACQVMPFCDEKRLVVVHDYLGKKNESEKKIITKYLESPNLSTCLVFFSTQKSEFFTSFENKATKIDCEKLSFEGLISLANNLATQSKINFTPQALRKLLDYCNYSVTKVVTEISKFKSVVLTNNQVEESDIENHVRKDIEYVIFDLTSAISKKQNDKVYLLIDAMIKNKEQPVTIISTLANHFRRLFLISRSGFPNSELSSMLGIKEFAISKYKEQTTYFTQRQLKNIFDKCIEVEYMAKTGEMDAKNAVSYLVANILL